jgi:6-phosphogluconolactonase (cycloisomerase 2 family)
VAVARDGPFFLLGACDTADPVAVPNLEPDAEAPAPTVAADPGQDALDGGAVFILSNEAEGNAVLAFERASDGTLAPAGTFPTEGLGSGDGLNEASNTMALAAGNRLLYAVNGGSDEISMFGVKGAALSFIGKVPSGGPRPISIAVYRQLVFVLNAGRPGEPGNIAGFRIRGGGELQPLHNATRPLNPGAGSPSQIGFDPSGGLLVVTDKPSGTITTYAVQANGRTGPPQVQPSSGDTPVGFAFDGAGRLVVSEAGGAASSYEIGPAGGLFPVSASVQGVHPLCWLEIEGRFAYASGAVAITGYHIGPGGTLDLLGENGVVAFSGAGSAPRDMDIAMGYLYVHLGGDRSIGVYRIQDEGGLTPVAGGFASPVPLPTTAVGVAAY